MAYTRGDAVGPLGTGRVELARIHHNGSGTLVSLEVHPTNQVLIH